MTKRAIDLFLAVVGLILASPLMGLIAVAIRLDGSGNVIYRQERLGRRGKPFTLLKFRKFPDAHGDIGPGVTVANDLRMTRLGEILERFKLDELPQLWNILRGDMSFVGPRPESVRYQDLFKGELEKVLDFMPGIFGPNQIAYRNESQMYPPDRDPEDYYREVLFPQKARADLEYFGQASTLQDCIWIVRGIFSVVYGAIDWRRVLGLHGRIVFIDVTAIVAAWILANLIRFGGLPDDRNLDAFISGLWLMPVVVAPLMMIGGCYRHPVRLFALVDALRLCVVVSITWGLSYLILIGFFQRHTSVMLAPLGLLLLLPIMLGPRIWWREKWRRTLSEDGRDEWRRLVIYGAGRRGSALVSLLQQGFPKAKIIGFLDDDDKAVRGRVIQGYRVLGSERDLATVHAVHGVEQIWLTFIPDEHKYKRLSEWCTRNDIELIVLPATQPFASLVYGHSVPYLQEGEDPGAGRREDRESKHGSEAATATRSQQVATRS